MTFLWVTFWLFMGLHLLCCWVNANDWKLRGWAIGLVLFLQITQYANSAEHSIVVQPEFTISAQSDGETLTIVPQTCGKVSFVEVITDPPSTGLRIVDDTILCDTSATRGVFKCVVCENNRCTPVEIFFTGVEVIGVNTPTPVGVNTSNYFAVNHPFKLIGLLVAVGGGFFLLTQILGYYGIVR